jgi:hypothetical protein
LDYTLDVFNAFRLFSRGVGGIKTDQVLQNFCWLRVAMGIGAHCYFFRPVTCYGYCKIYGAKIQGVISEKLNITKDIT